MTDLQTLFPVQKPVPFLGRDVMVRGLSFRRLAQLFAEYPELLALASGKAFDVADAMLKAPDACLKIVAFALADDDGDAILKAFDDADVGVQMELLIEILGLTFSKPAARAFLAGLLSRPDEGASAPSSAETSPGSGDSSSMATGNPPTASPA